MNPFLTLSCLLIFILLYFIMAQYFGHRRFNYLQETAIAIIVGIIVGLLIFYFSDFFQNSDGDSQGFIKDMIMLILLPPIMFEDGYNFPRRKFFQNILYINLYGLLGTVLHFFVLYGMLYGFNQANLFVSVSDAQEPIVLNNWQILLIATALCSIEPLVTQKTVDKQRYPKLFSIVFGEALFKDTLSVTFFESICDLVSDSGDQSFDIGGQEVGILVLRFIEVIICSLLLGIIMGLLITIVFKNMRFLVKEKGISQMALTIVTGMLSYVLSEWAGWSGVISMLFCGTVLAHYNSYNLTEQGKQTTLVTIQVLKIAASGVIFFFLGFEIFDVQSFNSIVDGSTKLSFSASLLGLTFLSLLVGRIVNVFLVSLLGWLLAKKGKWRLNMYEYWILFLGGLVHGAVPFALSVTIPMLTGDPTSNCTQVNIIAVVLITSLVFNIFIPKVEKILLSQIREMQKNQANHPSVKQSFGINHKHESHKKLEIDDLNTPLLDRFKSSTQKYWRKFEEGVLKPFLIYNYRERREQIKLQKVRLRFEEHRRYMDRFADPENILNAQNEDQNKFIQIKHSENSGTSEDGEKGVMKVKRLKKKKQKLILEVSSDKNTKKQKSQPKQKKLTKKSEQELSQQSFRKSEKLERKVFRLSSEKQKRKPTETQIVSLSSLKKQQPASDDQQIKLQIQQMKLQEPAYDPQQAKPESKQPKRQVPSQKVESSHQ